MGDEVSASLSDLSEGSPEQASIGSGDTLAAQGGESRGVAISGSSAIPKQDVARVGMRLGRYELTSELGEGGMATVFAARDTKLGREVAVKVLFPHLAKRKEAASRFKREARAAAGLDHQHILRVLDVGGGDVIGDVLQPPYIVLERIEGTDLNEFFEDCELPMAEIVAAIGVAMCSALEVAHGEGIVHRDIKPANIMVSDKGRLVLADFGVARVSDEDSVVTRTGALLGTPAYMSPEQATGDTVDHRSDIYSLGATLYKIATASLPYGGGTAQVVAAILADKKQEAERLRPAVGRELSRVIEKMMHRDVDKRYASASEAKTALSDIVGGGGYPDSEKLLLAYFCDPAKLEKEMSARVIRSSLARAARLAEAGRKSLALSLGERVLVLDPDNIQARALVRNLVTGKPPRVWIAVAGPMVVTGAVAFAFWGYSPGEAPPIYVEDAGLLDGGRSDAPIATASKVIEDAGPDAKSLGDVFDAGRTKSARIPRRPAITPMLDAAIELSPEQPEQPELKDAGSGAASKSRPKLAPASLIVNIRPWCDVWIDGTKVGRASATKTYSVQAGSHDIKCIQSATNLSWQERVILKPGQRKVLTGSLLTAMPLILRLQKADSARIDGVLYENGATRKLKAGRHRIELFSKGKSVGSAQYIDLRKRCILRDTPNLGCYGR